MVCSFTQFSGPLTPPIPTSVGLSADTNGDLLSPARDICVGTQAVSLQTEPFSPKSTLTSDGQLLVLVLDVIWFEVNENLHVVTVFEMWPSSLGC